MIEWVLYRAVMTRLTAPFPWDADTVTINEEGEIMERQDRMCGQCRHDFSAHDAETDVCMMYADSPSACGCSKFQSTVEPLKVVTHNSVVDNDKPDVAVFSRRVRVAFSFDPSATFCSECNHSASLHYETLAGDSGCNWINRPNNNNICACARMVFRVSYTPSEGCKLV